MIYEKPQVKMMKFDVEDVITTSAIADTTNETTAATRFGVTPQQKDKQLV